jgi:5'-nucleotidase
MRILLTNDDGIHAPGLELLEKIAAELSDDVWVCAPAEEQSGAGHSLTLHMPVRLVEHGERRFAVTGTPTDAVNLALRKLFADRAPDLVISGVNAGENLGDDVTYSGTISAAVEAALAGIPAVAMSQATRDGGHGFSAARFWAGNVHGPAHAGQRELPGPARRRGQGHPGRAPGLPRLLARLAGRRRRSSGAAVLLVRPGGHRDDA